MNNKLMKTMAPSQAWTGALVLLLPSLCLITLFGVGLSSFLFLLAALLMFRDGRAALARHWDESRWVVLAFLFNFGFALFCFLVRPEANLSSLEKPFRMFCAVSALMVVLVARPPRHALWWGVIAGAVGGLAMVGYQRFFAHIDRPGGMINPITFGDISLCLALVALAAAVDFRRSTRQVLWPALGALAGLLGSVITGSRGGWLALVLAAPLFARHGHLVRNWRVRALLVCSVAMVASLYFIPASGMQARVGQGIEEASTWYAGGNKSTSLGIRLELWRGAGMLIAEHPLFGLDSAAWQAPLARYVEQGRLDPVVLPVVSESHLHNDALQALTTGGVFGLLAWFGTLAAPFVFFARSAGRAVNPGRQQFAPALAGMLVVLSYFAFGLTEVIFWSVKSSMFYSLMVFVLMGFCLNAKEQRAKEQLGN